MQENVTHTNLGIQVLLLSSIESQLCKQEHPQW